MSARIKLVAIDIDGTLVNEATEICPENRRAIQAARDSGVMVTLATGRMYHSARRFALELGLDLPLITYQGALVKTGLTGEVIYTRLMPGELARRIIVKVRGYGYFFSVFVDDVLCAERDDEPLRRYTQRNDVPFQVVPDVLAHLDGREPTKILVIEDPVKIGALQAECRRELGQAAYITRSFPHFLEFVHPEASKAHGLAALGARLGVAREEMMAIGDSFNDLEMLQYAGLAVAMGNAPAEVQRAAHFVTLSNNEGGVAAALERFILGQEQEGGGHGG